MPKKLKKTAKKKTAKIPEEKILPIGIKRTKIRVIGIGGGGSSIVSEIASRMPKASFVVANTDLQALKSAGRKAIRFHFGESFTHGLGTGMNDELGREAAQAEKEKIKKIIEGQDLCILVACLGGGTSSGAVPIFARAAKNLGILSYGIFTLPFKFEGEKKMEIARESLKAVKNYLNALSVIPNEKVFQIISKETPLKQAFSIINKHLIESLGGLIETIYEPGLINIDFADFKTILEGKGRLAYLNTVEVQRKGNSAKDLIAQVLSSPLYPYTVKGAKGVLFNIAGEKNLSLSEVNVISKTISELTNTEAKIIFGISQSQKYSDTIKTTLLATGCGMKLFPKTKKKRRKKKLASSAAVKKRKRKTRKRKKKIVKKPLPVKKKITKSKRKKRRKKRKKSASWRKRKEKTKPNQKPKEKVAPTLENEAKTRDISDENKVKIRKNGLQIKKETEEAEQEMLEKEKFWEIPAFLRRKEK